MPIRALIWRKPRQIGRALTGSALLFLDADFMPPTHQKYLDWLDWKGGAPGHLSVIDLTEKEYERDIRDAEINNQPNLAIYFVPERRRINGCGLKKSVAAATLKRSR